ncbi:GNAT family N-acetyltransferase [Thalassobaculum sp. OXR-137]|uniref:GNAT family N-acetyltransferase n=1 Tax=Thalassobaculum sp. OXR-137 TaxID=3100173 RepID=UPI002AC98C0C|nr:GNAT family N-acetyltransferase [Thalassobaculum sp. OXR-137]WPZ34960.1 GNAT family N-acetyltransferase [Thalassobaculum sp. OXR-137]
MPDFQFELTTTPAAADLATVKAGMWRYVQSRLPGLPDESEDVSAALFARTADGTVIGGVQGNVYWNGLEVEQLWIEETHRRLGLARDLMTRLEDFARRHGAVIAYLRTVDARPFYERIGYAVYGTLEDRPIGTVLYHMKKRLDRG